MLCKAVKTNTTAFRKNRRNLPGPGLIVLLAFSALFLVKSANAQASTDQSAYRLIGTVMAGGFTGAVLGDAKGEQTFYRLHEILPDESKIVKVQNDSILLQRSDGARYEIFISQDTKTAVQQAVPQQGAAPSGPVIITGEPPVQKTFRGKRRRGQRSPKEEE